MSWLQLPTGRSYLGGGEWAARHRSEAGTIRLQKGVPAPAANCKNPYQLEFLQAKHEDYDTLRIILEAVVRIGENATKSVSVRRRKNLSEGVFERK